MAKQTLEQEYEALFKRPAYNLEEGRYNILYVEWLETKVNGLRAMIF